MESTVYFRAFEPEDATLIHEWKNSDELNKLTVGLNKKTCFEEDKKWVEDRMMHNPFQAFWAICAKETQEMIGWCCLTNIHYVNKSAEFGGMMIGNKNYQDGLAWIETHQFILDYTFERLGLNRLYGESVVGHKASNLMEEIMFFTREGIKRKSVYKNGQFYDTSFVSILSDEYFLHKDNGDYELKSIINRVRALRKAKG